jgi:hypothetical protein
MNNYNRFSVSELVSLAAVNAQLYRSDRAAADTGYGYELFRRAVVDACDACWDGIVDVYGPQIIVWIRSCPSYVCLDEVAEDYLPLVLGRFWRCVDVDGIRSMGRLGAVLNYLKMTTRSVVIDAARVRPNADPLDSILSRAFCDALPFEDVMIERDSCADWLACAKDERERLVVELVLMGGMASRDVLRRHGDVFDNISQVYRARERVLKRLRRRVAM